MDTSQQAAPGGPAGGEPAEETRQGLVHYSTGRLTSTQATTLDRWRDRLQKDKPLPGAEPKGPMLRLIGIDDRPRASGSDVIAAAVVDMLQHARPSGLDLAAYAEAGRRAAKLGGAAAARWQPVSYYLPEDRAALAEELRGQAWREAGDFRAALWRQAREEFPGREREQRAWVSAECFRRGLPAGPRQVTRGAIGRMAIDRWTRAPADQVAARGVDYAAEVHLQVHRARRDMRKLRD